MDEQVEPTLTMVRPDLNRSRLGLDRDERLVKDAILRMGSVVESQIRDAIRAMSERDAEWRRGSSRRMPA